MKIKKRTLYIIAAVIAISLAAYAVFLYINKNPYSFSDDKFHYSKFRGKLEYEMVLNFSNKTFDRYSLSFKSRSFLDYETRIYGILLMPKSTKKVPAVILLPGGGTAKESMLGRAFIMLDFGYAVLVLDQRGVGKTGGYYLDLEHDYQVFSEGKEPTQHLGVYDALRAFDVLRDLDGIDSDNIALFGESMGGRNAIIAAALDDRIKGVVAISAAGFHFVKNPSLPYSPYLLSVDPDNYIGDISPRKVFMFHGDSDKLIPLKEAQITFGRAGEPKQFYVAERCDHSYCDKMHDKLGEALGVLFEG